MNSESSRARLIRSLVVIGICAAVGVPVVTSAEKDAKKNAKNAKSAAPSAPLAWPLPPEQPRVRYVTAYRGVDDFKAAKKPSKFMTLLIGAQDAGSKPSDSMMKPYGIAVAPNGRVYISDTAARRVFAFDLDEKAVSFVGESGSGRLAKPIGVAVDADNRVFVADGTLKRVFGYGRDGELAVAIGHEGELESPAGLAIDRANKRLYVVDSAKHQVLSYSTENGALLKTIGKRGAEPGEFNFPTNLCVDAQGRLYVTDTLNFRVQVFDAEGTFVRTFGTLGDTPGSFNRPKGIAVDSEGHIYVADSSFGNFQIFDGEGQLLLFVGTVGYRPGEFVLPTGIAIDGRDRIYVADPGNSRIQVFQYLASRPANAADSQGER